MVSRQAAHMVICCPRSVSRERRETTLKNLLFSSKKFILLYDRFSVSGFWCSHSYGFWFLVLGFWQAHGSWSLERKGNRSHTTATTSSTMTNIHPASQLKLQISGHHFSAMLHPPLLHSPFPTPPCRNHTANKKHASVPSPPCPQPKSPTVLPPALPHPATPATKPLVARWHLKPKFKSTT